MTIDLSLLPDGGVSWLDASGDNADIVISTRIRLARNVAGYPFAGRARDGERLRILASVREAVHQAPATHDMQLMRVDELAGEDRRRASRLRLSSTRLGACEETAR